MKVRRKKLNREVKDALDAKVEEMLVARLEIVVAGKDTEIDNLRISLREADAYNKELEYRIETLQDRLPKARKRGPAFEDMGTIDALPEPPTPPARSEEAEEAVRAAIVALREAERRRLSQVQEATTRDERYRPNTTRVRMGGVDITNRIVGHHAETIPPPRRRQNRRSPR